MNEVKFKNEKEVLTNQIKQLLIDAKKIQQDTGQNEQKYAVARYIERFSLWKEKREVNRKQ